MGLDKFKVDGDVKDLLKHLIQRIHNGSIDIIKQDDLIIQINTCEIFAGHDIEWLGMIGGQ